MNKLKLIAKNVNFYSKFDDDLFFEGINKISCVSEIKGVGDELFIFLKRKNISDKCLRELINLFYRYNVEMSQLAIFLNENNKPGFFDNKDAFGYKNIFNN